MQKSKMILSITLVFLLTLTAIPLNTFAANRTITFQAARVKIENGTTQVLGYSAIIDGTTRNVPLAGYSETWVGGTLHIVKIDALIAYAGRYYKLFINKPGTEDGWTVSPGANLDVDLVGAEAGKLVFEFRIYDTGDVAVYPNFGRAGPVADIFRGVVIRSPDATLIAMQTGAGHVATDLIRTGDVEKLIFDGHTVTLDAGFHMGHIGFNMRSLAWQQANRDPGLQVWPLEDVAFRHALFHCYDQEAIVASIYGYTVTPVQSLVPPAQGGWVNPTVPKHPYNPGNPITSPAGEHSSCGILKANLYVFVDAAPAGVGPEDYWTKGGYAMPRMKLWTPTYETAPTSAEHGSRFVTDLGNIGLAATGSNGYSGFEHEPAEFADYMDKVDAALFDAYMVFWRLSRFPDHLFDMCHSSQICGPDPADKGKYNKPGINDPDIDDAVNTIKTSLNHAEKLQAAYDAQVYLYEETRPNAMGYMQLYSRIYFNGFNVWLRGIVKSPGFGSDNGWTYMNMHWAPGHEVYKTGTTKTMVTWIWGEPPERMNPCYASTVYAWDVIGKTLDGLLDVNPYTHEDLTAMSSQKPTIVEVGDHMEITFYIRKDIFWQDGTPYTAHDAKFNWDFFKYNEVPRYTTTWTYIDHVDVIDDYTVKVVTNAKSQFLVYDIAGLAAYLPPNVWGPLNNTGLPNILAYDPSTDTNAAGMGPWFGTDMGATTRLFGTGPFVFDYWDPVGQVFEVHQFPGFYRNTEDLEAQKAEMFHAIGDVYGDGWVYSDDRGAMGSRYGFWDWEPEYLDLADVNEDTVIDVIDLSLANFHFDEYSTVPP